MGGLCSVGLFLCYHSFKALNFATNCICGLRSLLICPDLPWLAIIAVNLPRSDIDKLEIHALMSNSFICKISWGGKMNLRLKCFDYPFNITKRLSAFGFLKERHIVCSGCGDKKKCSQVVVVVIITTSSPLGRPASSTIKRVAQHLDTYKYQQKHKNQ